MKILVDTNRYTDFMKNESTAREIFANADKIIVPFVTVAELRAGFNCGTRSRENEAVLVKFLSNRRVEVLYADSETLFVYANLYADLRKRGCPIPTNDLWIAALAVQHALPLCTRDSHFDNLPQVSRV